MRQLLLSNQVIELRAALQRQIQLTAAERARADAAEQRAAIAWRLLTRGRPPAE